MYPFKPPSIMMLTPSGRFVPGARICLSISDFHPESWNPLWSVGTILLGLQSFMYDSVTTTGALNNVSDAEKQRLAAASVDYNMKNHIFRSLFSHIVEKRNKTYKGMSRRVSKKESAAAPGDMQQPRNAHFRRDNVGRIPIDLAVVGIVLALVFSLVLYAYSSYVHLNIF